VSSIPSSIPPSPETAILVEDLAVTYRTVLDKKQTLRGLVAHRRSQPHQRPRSVQALRGVSFEVARGSVFGVIGPNGAGKSTLLRAIAGILPPSKGRVTVRGKISTLLALGLGFNANLTGRENILVGGLAAGFSTHEIEVKFDEIAAFADLGEFLEMPMKTYSSGMKGRLAFSVAVHMDPDILLIDEALSAGDAAFKRKSRDKMKQLCGEDRTIMLVSHGLESIKNMADEAIWLQKGQLVQRGEPSEVVAAYTTAVNTGEDPVAMEDL
jgi:teichoic acid transport system ATP-binding protein